MHIHSFIHTYVFISSRRCAPGRPPNLLGGLGRLPERAFTRGRERWQRDIGVESEKRTRKRRKAPSLAPAREGETFVCMVLYLFMGLACAHTIYQRRGGATRSKGAAARRRRRVYTWTLEVTHDSHCMPTQKHTHGEKREKEEKKRGRGGWKSHHTGQGQHKKRNKEPTGLIQPVCLSCRFLLSMLFCRSLLAVGTWGSLFVLVGTAASSRAVCVPSCLLVAVHACISSSIYQYTVSFFLSTFPITPASAPASGAAAAAPPPAAAGVAVASAARRGPAAPPPPAGPPAAASRAP